ncbi:DUF3307 domain-containing protein [Nocardiopsis dassonvillei]|uniref:DUF3307 domain-containing protein n=1 Tax=Nocardiopsis dassonvillei TaxID=2014 RepID=UPI00366E2F2E
MMTSAFAALLAGHWIGDHWAQSNHQAQTKGRCDAAGRRACAGHVGTLTLCQVLALVVVVLYADAAFGVVNLVVGLAVNAASHYWCDRRSTLEGLAYALHRTGKHDYYRVGSAQLDQAFHMLFILLSAVIIGAPTTTALIGSTGLAVAVLVACAFASRIGRDLKPRIDAQEQPQES